MGGTDTRRAPTAEEVDIAQAWVERYHGASPVDEAGGYYWAQDASDAYEMVLAVLAFTADRKAQTAPAVLLDRYNWRWYYVPETGEYREKLTGQHGTREQLESMRGPLSVVTPESAVSA